MAYKCKKVTAPIKIDGDLTKQEWQRCEKSHRFVDAVGGDPGLYDTRAALMWDEEALYIGFWCEEPFPKATLTERDSLLWVENDLEVFIDGGGRAAGYTLSGRTDGGRLVHTVGDESLRGTKVRVRVEKGSTYALFGSIVNE